VVIRRSFTGEVQQLLADVAAGDGPDAEVAREAAVARLRVIGPRALRQVLDALGHAGTTSARVALLRVLEGRGGPGVVDHVLAALHHDAEDVRTAGVSVARGLLDDDRGAEILDRLTTLALDVAEPAGVRLAAVGILVELPARTMAPILTRLRDDADPAVRFAASPRVGASSDPGDELDEASRGELPADPQRLLDALARDGDDAPLPTLHRLVIALREREQRERRDTERAGWLVVRGAVHELLARRDSRVALYDLRETIEAAGGPLPSSYLTASAGIGDAACLEAIGAAYARAAASDHERTWRADLGTAARAIAKREKITSRHEVVRRIQARWGDGIAGMLRASPRP
jgi:hypothetical protein